jgi:hypothetical protein
LHCIETKLPQNLDKNINYLLIPPKKSSQKILPKYFSQKKPPKKFLPKNPPKKFPRNSPKNPKKFS